MFLAAATNPILYSAPEEPPIAECRVLESHERNKDGLFENWFK